MTTPFVRAETRHLRTRAPLLLAFASLLLPGSSLADTASRSLSLQSTSGPVEPSRGQLDLELGYDYRTGDYLPGSGDAAGSDTAIWTVHQLELRATYGIADRVAAYIDLPILYPSLSNPLLSEPLQNDLPLAGDVSFGLRWRFLEKRRPWTGVTLELRGQAPTGLEASGDAGSTLLTGTGIPEAGAGLSVRRGLLGGRLAVTLSAGGTARISQVVAYAEAVQADGARGDARFHPGNQVDARLALQVDPIPRVRFELSAHGAYLGVFAMGTTTSRIFPARDLTPIEGWEGFYADAGARLGLVLGPKVEAVLAGRYLYTTRAIPELQALGLEAYSPWPGWSVGINLLTRL